VPGSPLFSLSSHYSLSHHAIFLSPHCTFALLCLLAYSSPLSLRQQEEGRTRIPLPWCLVRVYLPLLHYLRICTTHLHYPHLPRSLIHPPLLAGSYQPDCLLHRDTSSNVPHYLPASKATSHGTTRAGSHPFITLPVLFRPTHSADCAFAGNSLLCVCAFLFCCARTTACLHALRAPATTHSSCPFHLPRLTTLPSPACIPLSLPGWLVWRSSVCMVCCPLVLPASARLRAAAFPVPAAASLLPFTIPCRATPQATRWSKYTAAAVGGATSPYGSPAWQWTDVIARAWRRKQRTNAP